MARYRVNGNELAKYLKVRDNAVSNLKNSQTMPRIDGNKLNNICNGLSKLSGTKITPNDLLEFSLDEKITESK